MRASFMVLGPLARALRPRARVAARRLRDRRAARRPAPEGHGGARREDRARGRLRRGARHAAARRARRSSTCRTVNGTQNVLMAAVLAEGTTEIENAASEPEVQELIAVLRAMGAQHRAGERRPPDRAGRARASRACVTSWRAIGSRRARCSPPAAMVRGRRREGHRHRARAPRRRARQVPRGRARVEVGRGLGARCAARRLSRPARQDRPVPRLSDRHAGPDHGRC